MKDFNLWLNDQTPFGPKPEEREGWSEFHRRVLPEGVEERRDGGLYCLCCRCQTEIDIEPDMLDHSRFDPAGAYCFGSPGCIP